MLLLIFLAGFLLLSRITLKNSLLERLGFALPTGLASITLVMILMDWAHIGLTRTSLSIATAGVLIVALAINCRRYKQFIPHPNNFALNFNWVNLLWVAIMGIVVYLEYINFAKCMVYPVYDRDSLAAFDTIGFVCAQEHTFHAMSIFDPVYFPHMHEAGSSISYLPMIQLSYAYVYVFGAATSKAIPAFIYLGFLVGFYGLCRRKISHTGSALVLLGIISAPEMLAFASLSVTNVMQACMASSGIVYTCLWLRDRKSSDLVLAVLLLAINNWMRAEGIVFIGAAWLMVIVGSLRNKDWRSALLPAASLLPLVLWLLYSKSCGLYAESAIIAHPYWDGEKAATIIGGAWSLFFRGVYYGWTFHLFAIVLVASIIGRYIISRIRKKSQHTSTDSHNYSELLVPAALLISVIGYYLLLYQVDYKWDSIDNVLAYSAKRFNFCFVPLAWYYIADAAPVNRLFTWLEKVLGLGGTVTLQAGKESKK